MERTTVKEGNGGDRIKGKDNSRARGREQRKRVIKQGLKRGQINTNTPRLSAKLPDPL